MPVKTQEKKGSVQAARSAGSFLDQRGQGLREMRSELRRVVWPTRQEATNLTLVVIGVSVAVGVFLGVVDFLFAQGFQLLLR